MFTGSQRFSLSPVSRTWIRMISVFFLLFVLSIGFSHGQPNPTTGRMQISIAGEEALSPQVFPSGESVCVVWSQFEDDFYRLFSRYWNGSQWSSPATIEAGYGDALYPLGTRSGGALLVAWTENQGSGFGRIHLMRSMDQGQSWQPSEALSDWHTGAGGAALAASGNRVCLAWTDSSSGLMALRYRTSLDQGTVWTAEKSLAVSSQDCRHPTMCVSGNQVYVAWEDWRHGQPEIYYQRSLDNGGTWSSATAMSVVDSFASERPAIACSGQVICLVWQEDTLTNPALMIIRSTNGGSSWTRRKLAEAEGSLVSPVIAADGNQMVLGFIEGNGPAARLEILKSSDSGQTWSSFDSYSADPAAWLGLPSLGAAGGIIYAAWCQHHSQGFSSLISRNPPFAPPAHPLLLIY